VKTGRNINTLKIILDIPEKDEPNEIHLVINGFEYLFVKENYQYEYTINNNTMSKVLINTRNNALLNAIEKLPSEKYKNGDGRKVKCITDRYKICLSTVYQAQKLLRDAPFDILEKVRNGDMQIKTAYKLVKEYEKYLEENQQKNKKIVKK